MYAKEVPYEPTAVKQSDLQKRANELFKRTAGRTMANARQAPTASPPPSTRRIAATGGAPSPLRRAANLAQRGVSATVRTARQSARKPLRGVTERIGSARPRPTGGEHPPVTKRPKRLGFGGDARPSDGEHAPPKKGPRRLSFGGAGDLHHHHPPPPPQQAKRAGAGARRQRGKQSKTSRTARAKPSSSSTDPSRDCQQLGYRPLGPIAAGAFSTIRHARAEAAHLGLPLGTEVAIKTWSVATCQKNPGLGHTRDEELRTLHRAGLAPHDHVANLLRIHEGPLYTHAVLEYCGGGSLLRHLQRLQTSKPVGPSAAVSATQGAMAEAHARKVCAQLASALDFLHGLGIAHRDVKPANVLFTDGTRSAVKLCDFGFAIHCGDQKLKMRCGTPIYSAPELIAGREYHGPPVDMWAFGAMAYEMLHGKPAFHGVGINGLEQRIRTGSHSPFSNEVGADARALVQGCLVHAPSHRLSARKALAHAWLHTDAGAPRAAAPSAAAEPSTPCAPDACAPPAEAATPPSDVTVYRSRVGARSRLSRDGPMDDDEEQGAPDPATLGRTVV